MADIERVRGTWPFPSVKPDERRQPPQQPRQARRPAARKPATGTPAAGGGKRGRRLDEYA